MGDVGERATVHKRRVVLKRLHKVWLHRVFQQNSHRAVSLDIARNTQAYGRGDRPRSYDPDVPANPSGLLARQRIAITSEATVMSKPASRGKAVCNAAKRRRDLTQGAVVHVKNTTPRQRGGCRSQGCCPNRCGCRASQTAGSARM